MTGDDREANGEAAKIFGSFIIQIQKDSAYYRKYLVTMTKLNE
jgi:hypothetical protein